ncbi:uncharacterized protein LOC131178364 [Hevea brasiliensis]|uniref:uncharacterized protein LOC131178364 n=1 Tax=Hevea brasiliensis TaxID=3981 RepID=UPI0025E9DF5D|nr:uncharacterized protein LOC131178364 [Hevea brasiliensis]
MALAEAVKEVLWLQGLVDDLGLIQNKTRIVTRLESFPLRPDWDKNETFSLILPVDVDLTVEPFCQSFYEFWKYFGAHATFNVWNPTTFNNEFSSSQMWTGAGDGLEVNTPEAGWQVNYSDDKTRLFIYWTSDLNGRTGCYNLDCAGFVQTNEDIAWGAILARISTYGGPQYTIDIRIKKFVSRLAKWKLLAIFSRSLFWILACCHLKFLVKHANSVTWGGRIRNSQPNGHHTSTEMGSGHFPSEGFGKASMINNLGYVNESGVLSDPEIFVPFVTKPSYYDVQLGKPEQNGYVTYFFFRGPGFSKTCP